MIQKAEISKGGLWLTHFLLLFTMAAWGFTFAAGKTASEGAGPFAVSFWRFVLSLLVLFPQLAFSEGLSLKKTPPLAWLLLVLSGLTGLAAYNYFFIKGLALTEAGRGSVIVVVNPVFIYLGSVIFFHEKLTPVRAAGMLLAVFGMLVVVSSGSPLSLFRGQYNRGDLLLLGCVFSWTFYSLIGKVVLGRVTHLAANAWSTAFALLLVTPVLLASEEPFLGFLSFGPKTWLAVAFLGVFGTALGFTFFYRGILALGPHKASVYITLVPFFGLLSGVLVHGEKVGAHVVAGLFVCLFGLALVQKY